jgi:hypothetical protein
MQRTIPSEAEKAPQPPKNNKMKVNESINRLSLKEGPSVDKIKAAH